MTEGIHRNPAISVALLLSLLLCRHAAVAHAEQSNCHGKLLVWDCPAFGCAEKGTPEADANRVRNAHPGGCGPDLCDQRETHIVGTDPVSGKGTPPIPIVINDFETLQIAANDVGLQGFAIPVGGRVRYRMLVEKKNIRRWIGEGTLVSVRGYVVGTPRPRRSDSANCRIVGRNNNNIRFNVAEEAGDTEFDSIIAEITPRCRKTCWSLSALRKIPPGVAIKIVGQLFYDNKHLVNSDPDNEIAGQPKRLSLWEIHPVTAIFTCSAPNNLCKLGDDAHWTSLRKTD